LFKKVTLFKLIGLETGRRLGDSVTDETCSAADVFCAKA